MTLETKSQLLQIQICHKYSMKFLFAENSNGLLDNEIFSLFFKF